MLSVTLTMVFCRCWMLRISHAAEFSLSVTYFLVSSLEFPARALR
jgi:hypothetical protein